MSLDVKIVTPERITFEGSADRVVAPGLLGEFEVLPQHAQLLTLTRPGVVTLQSGGEPKRWLVGHGFAEVGPDRITLLVDLSENVADIDRAQAQKDLEEGERAMSEAETGSEPQKFAQRRIELARARLSS